MLNEKINLLITADSSLLSKLRWVNNSKLRSNNAIIFGVDTSSSVHINTKKKDALLLVEGPKQGLDDTKVTAKGKYSIYFSGSRNFFFA